LRLAWRFICAALLLINLGGCGVEFDHMAEARAAYARAARGPILIAAVEDDYGPSFIQGIDLAVTQANAGDGLLGRPLEVRRFPSSETAADVRSVARRIAADPRISTVLGHRSSKIAMPASVVYEQARILFLPSFATSEQLTRHGFAFVLRTLPDNAVMAAQTASVAELTGHRRLVVLHSREDYARELAFLFQDEARALGLQIAFTGSFFDTETNFRGILGQLRRVEFDAIYLSSDSVVGAKVLKQFRELGFEQPAFGSDRLAYGDFIELVGRHGDRTVAPTVYDLDDPGPRNQAFVEAFRAAVGREPNQAAAQGYDSARLFIDIVRAAGSTEPSVLATAARYSPPRAGVTGIFSYDPRGDLYGKVFEFRVLRFRRWQSLPGVTAPYRLASFRQAREAIRREQSLTADTQAPSPESPPAEGLPPEPAAIDGTSKQIPEESTRLAQVDDVQAPVAEEGSAGLPVPRETPAVEMLTTARLSAADRNRIWLSLAHEILRFERLGLVVPQTTAGSAAVGLARSLSAALGFELEVCELPPGSPGAEDRLAAQNDRTAPPETTPTAEATATGNEGSELEPHEEAAVRCWSRLARVADTVMLVPDNGLPEELVRRLNLALRDFQVPSFMLSSELPHDLGLTLALVGSGLDLDDPRFAVRFEGVLEGTSVNALNRKLNNLPAVSADLAAFAQIGISPDPRVLTLVSRAMEPEFRAPNPPLPPADPEAASAADSQSDRLAEPQSVPAQAESNDAAQRNNSNQTPTAASASPEQPEADDD
jgi:branched-chain amino acid transport system substrate-binding protein